MSATATAPAAATFAVPNGKNIAHIVPDGTKSNDDPTREFVADCGAKLSLIATVEDDSRAERVAGKSVCKNCRSARARAAAKAESEPVAEPAKPAAKKPSKSASIEKLSKTETAALVAKLDSLSKKRDQYVEDRSKGVDVEKRRQRKAYAEYEAAYARIRRSGQTVREARALVAK